MSTAKVERGHIYNSAASPLFLIGHASVVDSSIFSKKFSISDFRHSTVHAAQWVMGVNCSQARFASGLLFSPAVR